MILLRAISPCAYLLLFILGGQSNLRAEDFQPDPATVQRYGAGFRYPQAGWTVVHIEGDPYERGMQHGRLLAPEIAGFISTLASNVGCEPGAWQLKRSYVNAMLTRYFTKEQLQEMQGIADGAAAAGAQFSGHAVDLTDIVVINTTTEMESVDLALSATPTGMGDLRPAAVPKLQARPVRRQGEHCCAFAANGAATRDGKIVFGHVTTDDIRPAYYFNIWLDLKPTSGHHFVMQTVPGGIYSSMDYSISDSGILMAETNISQTSFVLGGKPLASRVRQVTQYAESIDQTVSIMKDDQNGLGSAEWVLADLKTNEIALLVLGTHTHKLFRSSKNEWLAGAEGFYWSCDNSKDRAVRLESVADKTGSPAPVAALNTTKRDNVWLRLYDQNKGHIDADFARMALTTPALATAHAVDALYTTTDLALKLQSWACFGPPTGVIRMPTFADRQRSHEVRALVVNPWTILQTVPPAVAAKSEAVPSADLHDPVNGGFPGRVDKPAEPPLPPLWHGTLVPASDADIWLTNSFALYRGLATRWKFLSEKARAGEINPRSMDDVATELFYYRSVYEQGARRGTEVPLSKIRANYRDLIWSQIALGKGVLLLHSLNGLVGDEKFYELMEQFGQANGGKEVSSRQFQEFIEKGTGRSWAEFFDAWLNHTGLPILELGAIEPRRESDGWHTKVTVLRNEAGAPLTTEVTVVTDKGETSATAKLEKLQDTVEIITAEAPLRTMVDKYRISSSGNGVPFTALTYDNDLENCLILYGTLDEVDANREAANMLQEGLRSHQHGITVPFKADKDATEEDLKNHHLILIGHPGTNSLAARFRDKIPVPFGPHSFSVRGITYAHPESSVLVAAENPLNRKFSLVLFAGLGTRATVDFVRKLDEDNLSFAPVVLLPAGQRAHNLVLLPKELTREIPTPAIGK